MDSKKERKAHIKLTKKLNVNLSNLGKFLQFFA